MRQGDIYWVNLEPVEGSEQGGKRPVVIISGPMMNRNLDVVIVCPLTTKIKKYAGFVFVEKNKQNGLQKDSQIVAFQVRTLSKNRFGDQIGRINQEQVHQVIRTLNDVMIY